MIRKAFENDLVRIAEILVFVKRINYRHIFCCDYFSFNILRVTDTLNEQRAFLDEMWVYEDEEIVKGFVHIHNNEIKELYVDHFFQEQGIGSQLIEFAVKQHKADHLWVLEKNNRAIKFYKKNGFLLRTDRRLIEGTDQYVVKMVLE